MSWTQKGLDIDGEYAFDYSGESVALSSDGNTLAIGATNNIGNGNYSGNVRVYSWVGGATVPSLSDFSISTKTYGDSPFTITPPKSTSDGPFTYSSSDSTIASISDNQKITIHKAGTVTIRATQSETSNYTSNFIEALFQINNSSSTNPTSVNNSSEFDYILDSQAVYVNIENNIIVDNDLISTTEKIIIAKDKNIIITRV
jgi:hypothetical protein